MAGTGGGRSRKRHTKSRQGCGTCKRRHIRCDENFPQCLNCTKYRSRCSYKDTYDLDERAPTKRTDSPTNAEIQSEIVRLQPTPDVLFRDLYVYPSTSPNELSRSWVWPELLVSFPTFHSDICTFEDCCSDLPRYDDQASTSDQECLTTISTNPHSTTAFNAFGLDLSNSGFLVTPSFDEFGYYQSNTTLNFGGSTVIKNDYGHSFALDDQGLKMRS